MKVTRHSPVFIAETVESEGDCRLAFEVDDNTVSVSISTERKACEIVSIESFETNAMTCQFKNGQQSIFVDRGFLHLDWLYNFQRAHNSIAPLLGVPELSSKYSMLFPLNI